MKTIIAGTRSITDEKKVFSILDTHINEISEVLCGMADGIDKLGFSWAKQNNILVRDFPAKWKDISVKPCLVKHNAYGAYNALAGLIRNEEMAKQAECLILIWDGKSNGSKHMLETAKKYKLKVHEYVRNW